MDRPNLNPGYPRDNRTNDLRRDQHDRRGGRDTNMKDSTGRSQQVASDRTFTLTSMPEQGKNLDGRWQNGSEGQNRKRTRSPDRTVVSDRSRGNEIGRDTKKLKLQQPQNHERNGSQQVLSTNRRSNSPPRGRHTSHLPGRLDRRSRR